VSDVTIRVLLAEDSALLRTGLVRLLEQVDALEVVGAVDDLPSLLAAVEADPPDVVVTDIRMPPTQRDEGLQAARLLREHFAQVGVVVLSNHVAPAYAVELLGSGSGRRAYLLKERVSDVDELVDAIERVASGGSVVDPKVIEALVAAGNSAARQGLERLTPREREVLTEMAAGRSNAAIAARLVLSERAVEKHSSNIFLKLDLTEEAELNRRVSAVLCWLEGGGPA
jgi:DNA-binding NarL/FixJ family response regulator